MKLGGKEEDIPIIKSTNISTFEMMKPFWKKGKLNRKTGPAAVNSSA